MTKARISNQKVVACGENGETILRVNSKDSKYACGATYWHCHGVTPYINENDLLENYIYMNQGGASHLGMFWFENIDSYPSELYFCVISKTTGAVTLRMAIYSGTSYKGYKQFSIGTAEDWTLRETDISDMWDTLAKLNDANFRFWYTAGAYFKVTQVYLRYVP